MRRIILLHASTLIAAAIAISGCGGSSTGGTTGGCGTTTTPDNGTLTTVADTTQFTLKNAATGLVLGIAGQNQTAGTALAQETNATSADALWHFIPMNNSQFNVENLLTHQLIGIT